jgi:hypothetical protein
VRRAPTAVKEVGLPHGLFDGHNILVLGSDCRGGLVRIPSVWDSRVWAKRMLESDAGTRFSGFQNVR